nr:helicase and polymerase-containing protein TEBICHI [Malus domestica]
MYVPRFSGPVFLTGGGSPSMQGEGNSSGDNSTSSFPNVERSTEYAAKASLEGRVHSEKAAELIVAEDLTEALLDFEFPLLPIPEGRNKGKQHPSTDKHCLDLLRDEHPIIPVIKEHRTLAKLLNCTLVSICSLGRLCEDTELVHITWSLAPNINSNWSPLMEEPNRQCVEHMVDFKIYKDGNGNETDVDQLNINARDYFIPTQIILR